MSAIELYADRQGSGAPVVLVHGFTGSGRSWDAVREHLNDSCSTLAIDLPGHGRSATPDDPSAYSLAATAQAIARVLDREGLGQALLVGYSMGGRAALRFALDFPDRCRGLLLESTSPGIREPAARETRRGQDESLARLLEVEGIGAFVRQWEQLPLWASQMRLDPASIARQREIRMSQSPAGLAASLRWAGAGVAPAVSDEELSSLPVTALLLAGALDATYVAHARAMAAVIPHADVHIEPEAGHAVHLERPLKFAALVGRFANALPL